MLWLVDQGSPSLLSPNPSPSNYNAVDTASAVAIALMTFGTMYPMSVYSGKVLLQVRTSQASRVRLFPRDSHLFVSTDHTPSRHWSAGQTAQRGETFTRCSQTGPVERHPRTNLSSVTVLFSLSGVHSGRGAGGPERTLLDRRLWIFGR